MTPRRIVSLLAIAMAFAAVVSAQGTSASIIGTVSDVSQGVLPGVTVSARNVETGFTRSGVTDSQGFFRFPLLTPGRYELKAELSGFQTTTRTGITLNVGSESQVKLILQVAGLTETVTVDAEPAIVNTTSSVVDQTLQRDQIDALPTISRDYRDFLRLLPGARPTREGEAFFGARPRSNGWQIDGVDNSSDVSGLQVLSPQLDSIAEFQVLTNNFKAESGRSVGGLVNAITRSGTNELHGSAFTYYRDQDFRARGPFDDPQSPKPPFERLYYGATLGGPIRKDKVHFFVAYQRQDQETNSEQTFVLPPADAPFSVGTLQFLRDIGINPSLFGSGGTQRFVNPSVNDSHKAIARLDYQLGRSNTLTMRYTFDKADSSIAATGTIGDFNRTSSFSTQHQVNINHKWMLSNQKVNELFFLFSTSDGGAQNDVGQLVNLVSSVPHVVAPGLALGGNQNNPQAANPRVFHLKDEFTWAMGNHQVKLGAELKTIDDNNNFVRALFQGVFTFPSLDEFVRGRPSRYEVTQGGDFLPLSNDIFGVFVQTDWRVKPGLTLNLGVRWDYENGKVVELVPGERFVLGGNILPGQGAQDDAMSSDYNNVSPRIGFVWAPGNDQKQAFYGGTGIYHDELILNAFQSTLLSPPRQNRFQIDNPGFPQPAGDGRIVGAQRVSFLDPDIATPYAWNTILGYRRELLSDLGLDVSFIYNRGWGQPMFVDANAAPAGSANINGAGARRPIPEVSVARRFGNYGDTRFVGMTVNLRKRMSRRFQGNIAYTLAKAEDIGFFHVSQIQFATQPELNEGPSDDDIRHRLVSHAEVNLPWDFQLATIFEFRSERPLNVLAGGRDVDGDGNTNDWVNEKVCVNVRCPGFDYSRNSVRELSTADANALRALFGLSPIAGFEDNPKYWNVDMSLRRRVKFGRHSVTLVGEAFNLFNSKQFTEPQANIISGLFGQRTGVLGTRTFQIGAHYRF
jgi:hypothetical protein